MDVVDGCRVPPRSAGVSTAAGAVAATGTGVVAGAVADVVAGAAANAVATTVLGAGVGPLGGTFVAARAVGVFGTGVSLSMIKIYIFIHVGSTGRNNDSYIFEGSSLKKFHETADIFAQSIKMIGDVNFPVLLIGDSAFRLSRYMMKPFPYSPNQPVLEKTFNYRLFKCRRVIENAFGQLKARFRKIGRGLPVAPKNVNVTIHTCCILHNFLKIENDEIPFSWIQDAAEIITEIQPHHTTRAGENDVTASAIINATALSFHEGDGDDDGNEGGSEHDGDGIGHDCDGSGHGGDGHEIKTKIIIFV
ncbi:uncharacterized protein LOC126764609 [Bactrocera neohumeralis]|uniref:uncharacterized protein LOC126764609 n=1 Tax=Bactrocera neohumeralis TaxID=98809 RepID=UPI0021653CD6|nr:uncharacterized protein LOC126764609 [Bactrocera neohumeralis]